MACSALFAAAAWLFASAASAVPNPGLSLAWGNCESEGGAHNQDFACDSDVQDLMLVGSFVLPVGAIGVTGIEIQVDLISATPTLPAWWQLEPNGCRDGLLFADDAAPPTNTLCPSWAPPPNAGTGGVASYGTELPTGIDPSVQPAHRTLVMGFAVASQHARDLVTGQEYLAFRFHLVTDGTVAGPPGPCGGCAAPVCLVLNQVNAISGTTSNIVVRNPSATQSNQATWQGGAGANCAAVPVKNVTWGRVKSLYR